MRVTHLNAGARGSTRLVHDNADRHELLHRIVSALGPSLLGYCLMDTHVHVLAEGEGVRGLTSAFRGYTRFFNARHRGEGPLLRGPVTAIDVPDDPREIGRALRYIHQNPLRTKPPLVESEVDHAWSSARAFAGLSRASYPHVARCVELLGRRPLPKWGPFADLEPAHVPTAGPELILAAAALTFGVDPDAVAGKLRTPVLVATRGAYVTLGRLESYSDAQLALFLGRTRSRITQIASGEIDLEGVRIARTLLREPALRVRLPLRARRGQTPQNG